MEEESGRRNHAEGIMEEESWRRNHGGGIMEEESWRRNHGRAPRRHPGSTQGAPRGYPGSTQEAPRGTQEPRGVSEGKSAKFIVFYSV